MSLPKYEVCGNCGAALHGRYCADCGQDAKEPVRPIRQVVAEGLSDLLSLDLRFPRTLWALVVPGRLTAEYLEGRRVPHVPPFRFALGTSLLLLLIVAYRIPAPSAITMEGGLAQDLAFVASSNPAVLAVFWLLTLPAFAAVLWMVFRRKVPLYLGHLTFALYFHSVFSLGLAALFALSFLANTIVVGRVGLVVLGFVTGPYLALALRHAYSASWGRVLLGWSLAASAYLVLFGLAFGLAVATVAWASTIGA